MDNVLRTERDKWINNFKNDWDCRISKINEEKEKKLKELEKKYSHEKNLLSMEKTNEIIRIKFCHEEKMKNLDKIHRNRHFYIEEWYEKQLEGFVSHNIKMDTIYDTVCRFVRKHLPFSSEDPDKMLVDNKTNEMINYHSTNKSQNKLSSKIKSKTFELNINGSNGDPEGGQRNDIIKDTTNNQTCEPGLSYQNKKNNESELEMIEPEYISYQTEG